MLNTRPGTEGSVWRRIGAFFLNPRNLYVIGLLLVLALSVSEVTRGRHKNFMIFAESTKLFWQQIAPYGANWPPAGFPVRLDYFLYGPLFNLPARMAGADRVECLQLHAVVRGDLHPARKVHP